MPTEKFVIEQAIKNKRPIPDRILNAPILAPGLEFYYNAFTTLSSCRPIGMAEGRIPWTAANDFSLRYGLDDAELDVLWSLISKMDSAYLEWQSKKIKSNDAIKPGGSKAPPKRSR